MPFTATGDPGKDPDSTMSEKEAISLAMENRHTRRMSIHAPNAAGDEDYDRQDLDDADEEELEDKIVELQYN